MKFKVNLAESPPPRIVAAKNLEPGQLGVCVQGSTNCLVGASALPVNLSGNPVGTKVDAMTRVRLLHVGESVTSTRVE